MTLPEEGQDEPVHLTEDATSGDRLLIYGTERGIRVELRYDSGALWMTQAQIAQLFGRDVSVISRHITNILEEGELSEEGSLQKMQTTQGGRPGTLYSLDMIISVGYRVSSAQATLFRRWATAILVRFATKGFVVDVERLKTPAEQDRVAELREIIREIRSSEANLYSEIRNICAMCQDYDPRSDAWREFYRNTQAKLCYAVTSQTPAQVISSRADALDENMGLQTWSSDNVRASDVTVAKNFLRPPEIKELNRLTDILLSIFEDQLDMGRLTTMAQAKEILDRQLGQLGRVVLTGGGPISKDAADHHARRQYQLYAEQRRVETKQRADAEYAALKALGNTLPKPRGKRSNRDEAS